MLGIHKHTLHLGVLGIQSIHALVALRHSGTICTPALKIHAFCTNYRAANNVNNTSCPQHLTTLGFFSNTNSTLGVDPNVDEL